uniref:Uncharacterized protein n=1 Tax=Rhizophora mucronata TaxID=61149 RepID=A0A2P2LQ35_RHIMU
MIWVSCQKFDGRMGQKRGKMAIIVIYRVDQTMGLLERIDMGVSCRNCNKSESPLSASAEQAKLLDGIKLLNC